MPKRTFSAEKIATKRFRIQIDQKVDNAYWFHIQGIKYPTSVSSENITQQFEVYPHPVIATSTIFLPASNKHLNLSVTLKDMFGTVVKNFGEINNDEQIVLLQSSNLANGVYFLYITEGFEQKTVKVVIQK
jgi:hypothetical protein